MSALDSLARYARSILLIVAAFLAGGATLIILLLPWLGWASYAIGHLGLLIALPALAVVYRSSMNIWAWLALAATYLGVVAALPVVALMLGYHFDNQALRHGVMPNEVTPLAMWAHGIQWAGLGLFGLAAWGPRAVPRGGAALFVVAGVLGLLAEFANFGVFFWGLAVVVASFGLVWVAPEERPSARRLGPATTAPPSV